MTNGCIVLIEDDIDDKLFFDDAFKDLNINNPVIWFNNCHEAEEYLINTKDQPFIILCDINLPGRTGIELKREIDKSNELKRKTVPFIFYTTSADETHILEAYTNLTVQGFFQKSSDFKEMKNDIKLIFEYWLRCLHPNSKPQK